MQHCQGATSGRDQPISYAGIILGVLPSIRHNASIIGEFSGILCEVSGLIVSSKY